MARDFDILLLGSIPALILLHLLVSPYTKVEESFHVQAIHDIVTYGIPSGNATVFFQKHYDHFSFPGAVPRTFVGALALSGISRPFIWLNENVDKQFLARGLLGLFNAYALLTYASGVRRAFGNTAATWYLLFQASQFHVIYYASRTLSNMFAFGITTLALGYLLPEPIPPEQYRKRARLALYLLTIAGIIFRSEIAILLGVQTIFLFLTGRIRIRQEIVPAGLCGLLIGLTITVGIDSFFWQQFPMWPEFEAFKFNVIAGQASAWGTHPWHFYFTSALPRLLLNPMTYVVCIPFSVLHPSIRSSSLYVLLPSLIYIAIYSFQPHKEWRFIVYAVPPLTTAAAIGSSYIWTHRAKTLIYRIQCILLILSTLFAFSISNLILLPASSANYPGAHALNALHKHAHNSQQVINVHLGNLACQTGVTRFLEMPPPASPLFNLPGSPDGSIPSLRSGSTRWIYDKTEDKQRKEKRSFWSLIDYALVEPHEERRVMASSRDGDKWRVVDVVDGFAGVRVLRPGEAPEGHVEDDIVRYVLGDGGVKFWNRVRSMLRKYVTRGWWVEVRMEPKITIMKHVR
ncbi:CAZyme family GT22 [Paecilomyces variotii]|nr:CAZyme family GT22 [Paecilomyces variotii]